MTNKLVLQGGKGLIISEKINSIHVSEFRRRLLFRDSFLVRFKLIPPELHCSPFLGLKNNSGGVNLNLTKSIHV